MTARTVAFAVVCGAVAACGGDGARSQTSAAPLQLERSIDLPGVTGRIDHLAVDVVHHRLFIAALGAGSVEVIELDRGQVGGRIPGLKEPQGLAYLPERAELVVATGDGVVRFYKRDLTLAGSVKLGEDADNVRVDPRNGRVVVGYGGGGLATIDPATRTVISTMPLSAHPEGFRLDPARGRVFVSLPGRGRIAVGDLASSRVTATWKAEHAAGYPLLFDSASDTVAVVYRVPPRLVITAAGTGKTLQDLAVCGDADDLFLDARRGRIYVSCGSGEIDVFQGDPKGYSRLDRIKTRPGARTSLLVPELDRLFVAARASAGRSASIQVYKPN